MSKFMNLIESVLDQGIEVKLFKQDGNLYADMNFQAKSHGWLVDDGEGIKLHMRYDKVVPIESETDLLYAFLEAYRMRDFGNVDWLEWCAKEGLVSKKTETRVSYS